ncbi:BID domain-containing T4SS effector [Bartonella machadoae]|uniref:BID domain-containing T4SS effector n=1 Tax=Bartonella machadoae TaxID=2893471 RepID=UPI001F4C5A78|nr:BID domain-containing T4SS effector [Bartonella machadoae]UNE53790.1 BID domain-containing T4SS effector [Bartonella machadoae]
MKKNKPSPPHRSVQQLINFYEQTATGHTTSENLSQKPAAQSNKPSSPLEKKQQQQPIGSTPTSTKDILSTSVPSQPTPPLMRSDLPERSPSLETINTAMPQQGRGLSTILEEDEEVFFFSREGENSYATESPKKPPRTKSIQRDSTSSQENEALLAAATSQRPAMALSEQQMMLLLPHSQLVKTYQEKIQNLCHIAYGNKDALQAKMVEIQKNPTMEEELSWQTTAHLASSKLAGINLLGFKNQARRNAEESLSALCNALAGYKEAVKSAREDFLMNPDTVLMHYEHSMGREALTEILQNPAHPERAQHALSSAEISAMIQKEPAVKRYHAQVKYWSDVVFGNANLFTKQMEEIFQNPIIAEEFTWQLAAYPQSFHHYAGINMCGFRNNARRHAEAGLSHLIDAVDNYANAVNLQKEQLTAVHQKQHEPSTQQEKDLQRHHNLQKSSRVPEYLPSTSHLETREPSHTHEKRSDIHPQKVACPKTMALAN